MNLALLGKINVLHIVADHWATFTDLNGNPEKWDYVLFYGVPAVIAPAMAWQGVRLSDAAIDSLTNALAILAGLLFNLIVLLHGLPAASSTHPVKESANKHTEQAFSNIAYCIIVAIATLIPLTVAANYEPKQTGRVVAGTIAGGLAFHFVLTMVMVLKRMHVAIGQDLASRASKRD